MKMNLLHSAFILTLLPVTSLFSSQQPVSPAAAASGAASPQPGAPAEPVDHFADLIAAAAAGAAQKQVSAAQPAGIPDLLGGNQPANPDAAALLASAAACVNNLAKKPDAQAEGAPNVPQQPPAALTPSAAQKSKAESSAGITSTVVGVASGVMGTFRSGYKRLKDSDGRKLLDRLEQCEREKKEFASGNPGQDTAMIALGVQDSIVKKKDENVSKMIEGLYGTKAKADATSRRSLRLYTKEKRDVAIGDFTEELNVRQKNLSRFYRNRFNAIQAEESLRKLTFEFADCNSDDEDNDCNLPEPEEFETALNNFFANIKKKFAAKAKSLKRNPNNAIADNKADKPALSAAAKPASPVAVPSPASAAGNL